MGLVLEFSFENETFTSKQFRSPIDINWQNPPPTAPAMKSQLQDFQEIPSRSEMGANRKKQSRKLKLYKKRTVAINQFIWRN